MGGGGSRGWGAHNRPGWGLGVSTTGGTGHGDSGRENSKNNWGDPKTLQDHFNRHGSNFGANNTDNYAKQANDFYNNRNNYQIKVDEKGIIRVYDSKTNTFGAYNPDGTTKTFFKPDLEKHPDFWDYQSGK